MFFLAIFVIKVITYIFFFIFICIMREKNIKSELYETFTHSLLLIKPRVFNISTDSSSVNDFSSLLLYILQIIEVTVLSKMHNILEYLNLLYILHLIQ